jgi:uncharacterized membrane protein YhaH (DUF805 family)
MPENQYMLDRDGQRYGPYTIAELSDYRTHGFVQGSDLVWSEGMPSWLPASTVLAGSHPSNPAAPPVVAKPTIDPPLYGSIRAAVAQVEPDTRGFFARMFSMEGRLNRGRYIGTLFAIFGLLCLVVLALVLAGAALGVSFGRSPSGDPGPFDLIVAIGFYVLAAFQMVKRFHDLDRPGTHFWLLLIPFYGFYLALLLLFQRGTEGPNQFGPDPLAQA